MLFDVTIDDNILKRSPFEAVSATLILPDGAAEIKAGTPISTSYEVVSSSPWSGVWGILLNDVSIKRPQGSILVRGYLNATYASEHSGVTYDDDLRVALIAKGSIIDFEYETNGSSDDGTSDVVDVGQADYMILNS